MGVVRRILFRKEIVGMKACDFIVRYLSETVGVDHVFTFAGGTNAMILDSVARHGQMKIVPMRHEENVALAADGYSRIKRNIGLALAMSGPGATNMITGIAQSYFDSSRVLYLTGNVTTGTYKYDRPLRQMGYQETDIVSLVKPITKNAYFVDRIERVAGALRTALWDCLAGRPGPCLYDIPFDIQKLDVDDAQLEVPFRQAETKTRLTESEFDRFAQLLRGSERPLILAGGGVQLSGTAPALAAFARRYRLPVVVSLLALDAFPGDDPLHVGFIGAYGNRHANKILAASDLVIALGTRIDSRQTASVKEFTNNKKVIHVDVDRNVIGSTLEPALGINMDLVDFFTDFAQYAEGSRLGWHAPESWHDAITKVRELLKDDTMEDKGALNPKKLVRRLTQVQAPGTLYTADVGSNQMWTAQCGVFKEGDRVILSGGLGTMGYAIPAAIGAHMASPDSRVLAIVGDGGFQMSIPELQTIHEFRVPVTVVVLNNGMLGLMKNFQDENFDGRYPATVIGYSVPEVKKIAQAYDLECYSLERDDKVDDALKWLGERRGPALLDVKVPTEWGPYPKVMPGSGLGKQRPPLSEDLEAAIEEALK
jgi:acetolactate synthase-1/2/3 large subunit